MKHAQEQIHTLTLQLLKDIKQYYLENEKWSFKFENNIRILDSNEIVANAWVVVVPVENEQWGGIDGIIIKIDDDTLAIKSYMDSSCGRPDIYKGIKKPDGKYDLEMIKK